MSPNPPQFSEIQSNGKTVVALSGDWTATRIAAVVSGIASTRLDFLEGSVASVDASKVSKLDSAGAWVLLDLLRRLNRGAEPLPVTALPEKFEPLLRAVEANLGAAQEIVKTTPFESIKRFVSRLKSTVASVGSWVTLSVMSGLALLSFCGETAMAFGASLLHPSRLRIRPALFNLRTAGFDALPIVGLLSLLLGIVVSYQSADQLRNYGASIFVADIVGLSMVREFSPLIVAIIVAGRSGSAYAAQIGTMAVTEELDSLSTIGVSSIDLLVIPKVIALAIAMPLLTVYADVLGKH
jgi:phospholipid/cholesterol/gamma-HCH transport system permease protein